MKSFVRLMCVLFVLTTIVAVGCGPSVSGPSDEPPTAPSEETFDADEEAAANPGE